MPNLKEQIPSVATAKEIPPIINLKEGHLKQNKPKDRAGDSSTIVINNSNNDNNNTILLPVPTAF